MNTHRSQQGAALMMALMFLVVLTMLGLAAVRATTVQARMAAGMQFQSSSFQAAEAAIRTVISEVNRATAQPAALLVAAQAAPVTRTPSFSSSQVATAAATVTFRDGCPGSPIANNTMTEIGACCFDIEGAAQYGSSNASSIQEQRIQISCPVLKGTVRS